MPDTGHWSHLGEPYRCAIPDCDARLGIGSRIWLEHDGTVLCEPHGEDRIAMLKAAKDPNVEVERTPCLVCSDDMDGKPPEQLTCSRKCGAAMRKRNERSADEAHAETGTGW